MVEVENLVKRYGAQVALDHVSFCLGEGKIYGLLGPNGAGKSTTMNVMTGYTAPTMGLVRIKGYDIVKTPQKAKQCIGYLPEIPPLYRNMTVKEYLVFCAGLKGIRKKNRKIHLQEIMERTKIQKISGRLIRNLSKGYCQRIGLAQAILGYPYLIILDEPTAGLDPQQILEMRDLLRELKEKHIILLSSHILSEIAAVCDEIMILSKGRLCASGTPVLLQRQMEGGSILEVHILGEPQAVKRVIDTVEGVNRYDLQPGTEDGVQHVSMEVSSQKDVRIQLFFALAAQNLPVLHMERKEYSLEEMFLKYTKREGEKEE